METTTNNSIEVLAKAIKKEIDSLEATISTRKAEIEAAYKAIVDKASTERDEALKEFAVEQDTKERLQASYDSLTGAKPKPATTTKAKKGKEADNEDKIKKPLEIPTEYPTTGKAYGAKTGYVLSKAKAPITKKQIIEEISKLDKDSDINKITAGVGSVLNGREYDTTMKVHKKEGVREFKYSLVVNKF